MLNDRCSVKRNFDPYIGKYEIMSKWWIRPLRADIVIYEVLVIINGLRLGVDIDVHRK